MGLSAKRITDLLPGAVAPGRGRRALGLREPCAGGQGPGGRTESGQAGRDGRLGKGRQPVRRVWVADVAFEPARLRDIIRQAVPARKISRNS